MPKPDFDQITVDLATRAGRGDILPHIKEALRHVWNARGAADRVALADLLIAQPSNICQPIQYALRKLDR